MTTRMSTFDANLLTRLDDENFQLDLPNHVFTFKTMMSLPSMPC